MEMYHKPVLLSDSIDGLAIKEDGTYVDTTYGGGGHAKEILNKLGKKGKLFAFDRDGDALRNKIEDDRLELINHNYKFLKNYLKYYKVVPVDGIIADLGISSFQIDNAGRGFSIRYDSDLDLRMDRNKRITGAEIVNSYEKAQLVRLFKEFGELGNAARIANTIIQKRQEERIRTTSDLKETLHGLNPVGQENKFLAKVFQALRIEVNKELDALEEMLKQSLEVLKPSGRLVVISYHSLEDRLVKNFMRTGNILGIEEKDPIYGNVTSPFLTVTRKPIVAGEKEIRMNNRARSARLRIAEKK
jgi:16S rRNA (cytosine1402-N4)-methyltransferase